jgi:hypothetical protein
MILTACPLSSTADCVGFYKYVTFKCWGDPSPNCGGLPNAVNPCNLVGGVYASNWSNVECSPTIPRVVKLSFFLQLLAGPLPTVIGQLDQLTFLSFSTNTLTGTVPTEMALLVNLVHMDFDLNKMSGSVYYYYLVVYCQSYYYYCYFRPVPSRYILIIAGVLAANLFLEQQVNGNNPYHYGVGNPSYASHLPHE